MPANQIIFLLGLSGSGKTTISDRLVEELNLIHINLDGRDRLRHYDLRRAWARYFGEHQEHDPTPLISALHKHMATHEKSGAVVSFPSNVILSREKIDVAKAASICTVVLWGTWKLCEQAARSRDPKMNPERYAKSNREAFETYSRPEYADVRVEAFGPDDSRLDPACIITDIQQRLAGY
jgi:shikimate kinase